MHAAPTVGSKPTHHEHILLEPWDPGSEEDDGKEGNAAEKASVEAARRPLALSTDIHCVRTKRIPQNSALEISLGSLANRPAPSAQSEPSPPVPALQQNEGATTSDRESNQDPKKIVDLLLDNALRGNAGNLGLVEVPKPVSALFGVSVLVRHA